MANAKISVHDKDSSKMLTITPAGEGDLDKDVVIQVPTDVANPIMARTIDIEALKTAIENGNVATKSDSKMTSKSYSLSAGIAAVNYTESVYHKITVDAAQAITFGGFTNGKVGSVVLEMINGGAAAITWPANLKWIAPDGSFVTSLADMSVTLNSAGKDFITVFSEDGGTTLYGKVVR